MCACNNRKTPEVVTSAQAAQEAAQRAAQDQEVMIASAANAVANAGSGNSGWYVVDNA
jgi:hypothetical protein